MKTQLTLILSLILLGGIYLNSFFKSQERPNPQNEESYNILLFGDTGTGDIFQKRVATKLNEIGEQKQSKMMLTLGDNFYSNGVSGLDDPQWNKKYANIYSTKNYLKDLPWYGTIGNHDFRGEGLFSEFEYNENNWKIEDFFWSHTAKFQGLKMAFIHVDTNFLAYGPQGAEDKMRQYFQELEWTSDKQMLDMVEEQILLYSDYDYILVMGHHHIGYSCPAVGNTQKLYDLLQKHKIDAYLCGHSHTLAFSIQDDMGLVVSGAAANQRQNECAEANPMWSKGYIYGFMNLNILPNEIEVEAHYINGDFLGGWKIHSLPSIRRRDKN